MIQLNREAETIYKNCYNKKILQLNLCMHFNNNQQMLSPKVFTTLVTQKCLHMIRVLILSQCQLQDNYISTITSLEWPHLFQLHLDRNALTCAGVDVLVKHQWTQMRYINLTMNKIKARGRITFLNKVQSSNLEHIQLASCFYNPRQFQIRDRKEQLPSLQILALKFAHLKTINLADNLLNDRDIRQLAGVFMPSLESLDVSDNCFGNRGAAYIFRSYYPNLRALSINKNCIDSHCFRLMPEAYMPRLCQLNINIGMLENAPFSDLYELLKIETNCLPLEAIQGKGRIGRKWVAGPGPSQSQLTLAKRRDWKAMLAARFMPTGKWNDEVRQTSRQREMLTQ